MAYETLQAIREEAGHHHLKNREAPSGTIDGANKDFYVEKAPYIADRNGSDTTTKDDVVAYVDGSAVSIDTIDEETGLVRLVAAPGVGTAVAITYAFTRLPDTTVDSVRDEAEGWVNQRVKSYVDPIPPTNADTLAVFKTVTRLYAAGLLLIRDYGSSADTDLTSKDGYKKMEQAEKLLKQFLADITDDSGTLTPAEPKLVSDGNIFERSTNLDDEFGASTAPDDAFLRKD